MTELGSTTLHYEATGASRRTDELGMREMQQRVWKQRDAQHLLVKSPPASGKSRAAMFVALDKLHSQGLRKVVIAVPERSIGSSFRATKLTDGDFPYDWQLDLDLCTVGSESGSKVRELIDFLRSDNGHAALCTHATLRFAFAEADGGGLDLFDGCLVCVDELHHASSDENSRLGNLLRGLIDRAGELQTDAAHILAMTGSYFRGDGTAVLHPEDEARFERVVYTYYEQLNGYEYLKTLHIGFRFYQGKYLEAIGEALDPNLKTIVHIPHVSSAEAHVGKMFAVDAIIDKLGERLGPNPTTSVDPTTGFVKITAGGKQLIVANLVDDGPDREKVLASLRGVEDRDEIDIIVALGMAKEGFDWVWCEHVLTVGYRGSLTEVVQIIGRATRDAPGKTEARFTNLVSAPFANDETVSRAVNDMLKAISVSLLMEQVMAPVFKFRTFKGADQFDGSPGDKPKDEPVTNAGEIEVLGMPQLDEEAERVIETDFNDLFADVQNDPRTLTVMINPDDHHTDVIYDMVVTDVIEKRYPSFTKEQVRDAVSLFGVRTGLAREVSKDPSIIQTNLFGEGEQSPYDPGTPATDGGIEQSSSAGDRFIREARRFINVRELEVDLLGGRQDFDDAYELLSKPLRDELLRRLHGEVRALKVPMTQEEAEKLYPRIKEFIAREGREPNLNAANGREVRLADALALMRRFARQKRAEAGDGEGAAGNG